MRSASRGSSRSPLARNRNRSPAAARRNGRRDRACVVRGRALSIADSRSRQLLLDVDDVGVVACPLRRELYSVNEPW
eukprot:1773819-Pyramimonas_sp.AAC.1